RYDDAIAAVVRAVPAAQRGETLMVAVYACIEGGQLPRAQSLLADAPPRARLATEAFLARARLLLEQGKTQVARTVAVDGVVHTRQGRFPAWIRGEAVNLLGRAQYELGEFRPAAKHLEEAVKLDPYNARAHLQLAFVDIELGQKPSAIEALDRASAADPRLA